MMRWVSALLLLAAGVVHAQAPDSPRYRAAIAARDLLTGTLSSEAFIEQKLDAGVRAEIGVDGAKRLIARLKGDLEGWELTGVRPHDETTAAMVWQRGDERRHVLVRFNADPPHGITDLALEDAGQAESPLSWGNLPARLEKEIAEGFSGVLVVIRDGEEVLALADGMANRAKGIGMRRDTIFGIGSIPIDFTQVGILMLAQQGKLSLDDPIAKYFDDVPKDKRSMTIEHLRTGRSGLQDFHGKPEDGNPDHAWIDRDEAVRRILGQELLFAPGEGRRHSHSAWGLLAAILEIVSGESYETFTTERIFKPLGMKDTGFYGQPLPEARMAVGYGMRQNGEINAPPYWGKTSWLVMGSGGQVSTADDLLRFVRGMNAGRLLDERHAELLLATWRGGPLAGGSIFGFEAMAGTDPDNTFVLLSNSNPDGGESRTIALGEALGDLVASASAPPFSLGVGLAIDSETGLSIDRVMPDSAAERDGLRAGDRLISANGTAFGDDPMAVLDPLLREGDAIRFRISRDGKELTVKVQPNPR